MSRSTRQLVTAVWAPVLIAVTACGDAGHEPSGSPIAYLTIGVAGKPQSVGGPLRAALFWHDHAVSGGVVVLDDQPASRDHAFEFGLYTRPAAQAEVNVTAEHGPVARAGLVAYVDTNGNGRFDFTDASADELADVVVGWVPGARVRYAPSPPATSATPRGIAWELSRRDDEGVNVTTEAPLTDAVTLHFFDHPSAACHGLSPPVDRLSDALTTAANSIEPTPGFVWPYPFASPPCPGNELPEDWYAIDCDATPGVYLVRRLVWPASEDLGALCGWTRAYCDLVPDTPPTAPEFPSCE